jgi:hypothetical protein
MAHVYEQKIGLFAYGELVKEYSIHQYAEVLEDAMFAYQETLIQHEIKYL